MNIIFSHHARSRIKTRQIPEQEVIETINYPEIIMKKHGKYYFQKETIRGKIEACCEKTEKNIYVITVYWI